MKTNNLKAAEKMPEADYGFKLTPPQMSFGEQMAHLASDQAALLAPFSNAKPAAPSKPASTPACSGSQQDWR